jgi:hypothetical protein
VAAQHGAPVTPTISQADADAMFANDLIRDVVDGT